MTLQPGEGAILGDRYLPATTEQVSWGWIPGAGAEPALVVDPGDVVTVDTVSHEGILEDQGRDPHRYFTDHGVSPDAILRDAIDLAASDVDHDPRTDGPHVVVGPIAVRGAAPGDVIEVEMLDLARRASYGVVSNRHGRGALSGEMPLQVVEDGPVSLLARVEHGPAGPQGTLDPWVRGGPAPRFPLRPFLGLVAIALEDETPIHSTAPGDHGGNLDVKDLGQGSSILCPVRTPGGLVSIGDPHYAQGNGEVALTAFEAPLRVTMRLTLHRGDDIARLAAVIGRPFGNTGSHLVIAGLGTTLDLAMRDSCRLAVAVLGEQWGLDPQTALAYLSCAADFDVSQVVNGIKGVHCRLRIDDLAHLGPATKP